MTVEQCYDWLNSLETAEVVKVGSDMFFKRVKTPVTLFSLTGAKPVDDGVRQWSNCFTQQSLSTLELAGLIAD